MTWGRVLVGACLPVVLVVALSGCRGGSGRDDTGALFNPAPGKLTVTSHPTGAAVLEDWHRRIGKTPLTVQRPGFTRVRLALVKDGYQIYRTTTLVEPGGNIRIAAELVPEQANLVVRSGVIRGARVKIDGEYRGRTPIKLDVAAGKDLTVEVSDDGFRPFHQRIRLAAGESKDLDAMLVPAGKRAVPMGWLSVASAEPALVTLDNAAFGSTPLTRVPIRAGKHRLKVTSHDQKRTRTLQITIRADEERKVTINLDASR